MPTTPKEGDVYKVLSVGGHTFTIRYGYYRDEERRSIDPMPIYPCFISAPRYTVDGFPLVTRIQDACEHYHCENGHDGDGWCSDCIYCYREHDEIGVCQCSQRRQILTGHPPALTTTA